MRNTIMVDIDDTLYDFKKLFIDRAEVMYGLNIDIDSLKTWDCIWNAFGPDPEKFATALDACYTADKIMANVAYHGAAEALTDLSAGHEIIYVSDRPEWAAADTAAWLMHFGFPNPTNLVCTTDKRGWITENRESLATIIDDRTRTLVHARLGGLDRVFSIYHAWNSSLSDADGVVLLPDWPRLGQSVSEYLAARVAS